ncbi:uncharacterized protein KD926_005476 [Aspergillus affinis]|uniref:uncharacterized protein n=1 Tax=Aspergillus affinis TaxID=1070780 RepID=UPI0022FF1621|nr:uncharacterized protein KD926_005476 [Aspergillus affinis]KAI9042398.1 hypothetical protein KD926_005476 [Aspergillus affinis]
MAQLEVSHEAAQARKTDITIQSQEVSVEIDAQQLLRLQAWNTPPPQSVECCIHDLIQTRCDTQPEAPAVCAWNGQLRYAELDVLASSLASALVARGVGPEKFVPVYLEKSLWTPIAMLAVLKAGGAFVLLDPSHPTQRIDEIFRTVKATIMIASKQTEGRVARLATEAIIIDDEKTDWTQNGKGIHTAVKPGNAAYTVFTSGTSGKPKGVVIEHRSFATTAVAHSRAMNMHDQSRVIQFASYAFDACLLEILTVLIVGGCICVPSEDERQHDLAAASRRMQVNWMFLTPSLARVLEVEEFPTLQTLVVGGEALQKEDMRKWAPHVQFFEAYGPTECAVICMARQCLVDDPDPVNIGFGAGVTCWIVDPDNHNQLAPIGSVGELLLDGAPIGRGYINDAERTASVFIDPPTWHRQLRPNASGRLYKTGDLACYATEDGSIRYIGRKDSQVKLRGQRLELGEIEFHIRRLFPTIANVVVEMVTPADMADSPILVAFILQETSSHIEADKVIMNPNDVFREQSQTTCSQLQKLVPKYMMPTVFLPLQSMPLLTSGKSDRRQLRNLAAALTRQQLQAYTDVTSSGNKRQPSTATTRAIQHLWSQVLRLPRDEVGLDDTFFGIGGSSVTAMKLLGIARRQGLKFDLGTLYSQTLEEIGGGREDQHLDAPETNTIGHFSLLPEGKSGEIIDCVMEQCKLQDQDQIEDVYPCTPLQEGLMSLTAKRPGAYIVVFKYDLPVAVKIYRFKKAWNSVVQANPILRTRIVQTTSGAMYQAVLREAVPWEAPTNTYDRHWNAGQRLVRLLLSSGPSNHFTLVVHHALSDGWAVPLVLKQVEAAYHGQILQHRPFNGFISYILRNADAQERFWKEQFVNLQAAVFPRLPHLGYIPNPTVKRTCVIPVEQDAAHSIFTAPTKLKLAWAILVSLYTDSPDIVFGITVTGRGAPVLDIEEMTGPTIATIPIQLHIDPEHTIAESLLQVQNHSIYTVPFEQAGLQNISRLGPDAAAACQFQSLMVIQPEQEPLPDMFSAVQDLSKLDAFSSYAITLICKQSPDSIQIEATFDPEVVDEIQMTRMLQQLRHIVQQLTPSNESLQIQSLNNTSTDDMAQLMQWNRDIPAASEKTLHGIVLHQRMIQPDADAVCAWDGELSYLELDDYSARLAQYLLSFGIIESESRVAVCLEKSRWTIVTLLAVLRAGGVCVLIDHGHPRRRIEDIISKTSPPLLVASATYEGVVQDLESKVILITETLIHSLPPFCIRLPEVSIHQAAIILFTSGSTGTPKGIVMEHINLSTSILAHSGPMNLSRTSRSLHFASYAFDVSIYEVLNTLAQGGCVCVPSESDRMNNLANVIRQQRINWALLTPSTLSLFGPADVPSLKTLVLAGEAVTRDPVDKWADKVTLINAYGPAEATFTTVGPIPPKGWRSGTIGHMYGSVGWVTDAHNPGKLAAIGAVGELLVEGPIVTRGYLGEPGKTAASYIATPSWLRDFRTKGDAGRLYRTGDLVQYNPDGTIRYVGRRDTQVKLRGQRIELGEVEYHVRNCLDLSAEVIAEIIVPQDSSSPILVAYTFRKCDDGDKIDDPEASDEEITMLLSPRPTFKAAVQQVESKLSDLIPSFMVPSMFLPLREVPLTRSGKVDRRRLREVTRSLSSSRFQLYSAQAKGSTKRPPSTKTEHLMQQIWAKILHKEARSIGLDDNFFRLGGDSISAMQVVAQCTDRGLRVTVATIFRTKTIAKLSKTLDGALSAIEKAGTQEVAFDLSPMQQMLFETAKEYNRCYESVVLHLGKKISSDEIKNALKVIIGNHPMLHARFNQTSKGKWSQSISEILEWDSVYQSHVLPFLDPTGFVSIRQKDIDVRKGHVFLCDRIEIEADGQSFLCLIAHQSIIDIFSWRIILMDLEALLANSSPLLSTSGFKTWCQLQSKHAVAATALTVDREFDVQAGTIEYEFSLSEQVTQALRGPANDTFNTKPIELLNATLLQSFTQTFAGCPTPTIFNQEDGRYSNPDLARTVGSFLTLSPIDVSVTQTDDIYNIIRKTKDERRSQYNHPISTAGSPKVVLNYRELDFQPQLTSFLQPICVSKNSVHLAHIEITAEVRNSHMVIKFAVNRMNRQQNMKLWMERFQQGLELASSVLPTMETTWTLSDFPLLSYTYPQLESFIQDVILPLKKDHLHIEDAYPCTPIQQGILLSQGRNFLHYRNRWSWVLHTRNGSPVDPERLRRAWQQVVQRHPLLRTVFFDSAHQDGSQNQAVLKEIPSEEVCVILPPSDNPLKKLEDYELPAIMPLRPPTRLIICGSPSGEAACLLDISHAVVDGMSRQIFWSDLCQAYEDKITSTSPATYREYFEYLAIQPLDDARSYWEEYLRDVQPCIFPGSSKPDDAVVHSRVDITLPFDKALRQFCLDYDVTLAMTFQLAWGLVLRTYLNADSACFGYVTSGRDVPIPNVDITVGPFINMLICNMSLQDTEKVLGLLERNQADFVQSLTHQALALGEKTRCSKVFDTALFNTVMSVQREEDEPSDELTLTFNDFKTEGGTEYDLGVNIEVSEKSIDVSLLYATSFLPDNQAENVIDAFQQALFGIMSDATARVRGLSLFGSLNKRNLETYTPQTLSPAHRCVHDLIQDQCLARPSSQAVCAWDGDFTYAEVDRLGSALASQLSQYNICQESFVAIYFEKSRWAIIAMIGVMKAGAAFIMLDPSYPLERLKGMSDDAQISVIISSETQKRTAASLAKHVVTISDHEEWSVTTFQSPLTVVPRNAFCALFTSGSTGKPKGVVIEHQAFSSAALAQGPALNLDSKSRVLQFASYAFDASVYENITTLIHGGCVCIPSESERRQDLPRAVASMEVNWAFLTPSVARILDPADFPSLKTMVLAGELISAKELRAWQDSLDLHLAYGPAECSIMCVGTDPVSEPTSGRNIGLAVGCRSWVVDPNDHEKLLPLGAVGELLIEGPGVGRGYINQVEKTAASFISSPSWLRELVSGQQFSIYKTGDLVRYNENGSLHYVSRKDTQVKIRGQRVELGEVEFHLRESFPNVQDAIAEVVKPSGESRPSTLMAFILQDRGETISPDLSIFGISGGIFKKDIATALSRLDEVLPTYMVPTMFVPLDHIPLTKTGKTDRRALKEAAAALTREQIDSFSSTSSTKRLPSTEAEIVLQRLLAQVLNLEVSEIGIDDHFFRLGGDSIIAMKLIPLARDAGYALDMTNIFNNPKLCDLAAASGADATQFKSDVLPFSLIGCNDMSPQTIIQLAAERCHISTDDIEDIYPCTPLQEGLMTLTAKTPGQYIARFDYDLAANIDLVRFQCAWDKIFRSNAILRTRIIQLDASNMLQVVVRDSIRWHVFETQEEYEQVKIPIMNLDDELAHFAMVKASGSFHLTLHHALYDGWSLPLLWSQVQASYRNDEPRQPRPFKHFIEHIQNVQGTEAFWQSQFTGLSAPIFPALPFPRHVPAPNSSLEHRISNPARANTEYTTSTLIQLAWAVIMSCYTESEEVLYGLTVNGRSAPVPGIEDIAGPTFATVPMRLHVRPGDTVDTLLTSLQQRSASMIPFQQIGLQYIRQLGPEPATACSFQCQLVIQSSGSSEQDGYTMAHVRSEHEDYSAFASVAFFMVCHLANNGDVAVIVNFDERVVHRVDATRMVQQFEHILRQLSNDVSKDLQISDLDLVSPQDHRQMMEWNSVVPLSVDSCVHDLVLQQCVQRPDASAISSWDGEVTYDSLNVLSGLLAQHLQALGIQPGSLVPLCFERSKWSIITMISVLRIGATCVNIDPSHPKGRIQEILQRTAARSVIVSAANQNLMAEADVSVITVPIFNATDRAERFIAPQIKPTDAAFVAFTSGSTGNPKGIVMEHRNICTSIRHHSPGLYVNENTRALHFASYAFDISLCEVFSVLVHGGCVCIPSEFDRMNNVIPFIKEHNVNWTFWTPSFLGLIQPDDIPGVKTVVLGGEPVTQDNIRIWASRVNLLNAYAPAETSICNILSRLPAVGWREGTIGRIFGAVAWITMPSDHSRLAPLGAVGELVIEGPTVTRGYLRDTGKTAAAYIENMPPWLSSFRSGSTTRLYRSGDLFQLNPDGSLRIIGRRDTQVKLRGQRIELGEVEQNLRELFPDAREVAAEVVAPSGGSPTLMAFIAYPSPGSEALFMSPSPDFLAKAATVTIELRHLLPKYMVPGVILQVSKIPHNSNGKVDRRLLREQAAALSREQIQTFSKVQSAKRVPATQRETLLRVLWADILQTSVEHIGADDDFFHLGGDSFAAMKLSAIARHQGLHLPVPFIFNNPVLSDLAKLISNVEANVASEYTPGSLLGITDIESFVAQLPPYPFNKQDVVDIVPTTEFQSRLMVEKDITYSQLRLPTHIDIERLEAAFHALVRNHAILRTVFIPYQNTHLQVVLRNLEFKLIKVVSEDLTASANKIITEDESSIPPGSPHFQPYLLSQTPTSHLLIFRLTHAQYDGASFRLLSEDLASAYNNSNQSLNSHLPFPTYLQFRHSQVTPRALSFWRNTLENSQMTDVLCHCSPSPPSEPESMVMELRSMTLPAPPPGITLASLLKAAWALALARTTNTRDIVFGQVTSGRDAPLKDIDTVSGPCITFSPFRVIIAPDATALDLLSHVQTQHIQALPYSNLDLREIVSRASPWPVGTEFGCAFTHQNAGLGFPCPIAGVESKWVLDVRTPEHLHIVTFPERGKLKAMLGGSSRRIRGVEAWGLMESTNLDNIHGEVSSDLHEEVPVHAKALHLGGELLACFFTGQADYKTSQCRWGGIMYPGSDRAGRTLAYNTVGVLIFYTCIGLTVGPRYPTEANFDYYQISLFRGTAHVKGKASGTLIASDLELSFWGGVNPQTGEVIDRHHPLSGQYLGDTILAIPGGRGSCSGSGVILELLLNKKGPSALLFERREDILTLGVMICEEVFGRSVPVVTLDPKDFRRVLSLSGKYIHVNGDHIYEAEIPGQYSLGDISHPLASFPSNIDLSDMDKAFLEGKYGEAARVSIRIVLRMARLLGARELINITQVHVDACVYTGPGSLLFAERLRELGGKVKVPTSLNSISIDQEHWRTQGVDEEFGEAAAKLAKAYTDMGARPTFTCAPYQLGTAPKYGEQVAWAESNAVVYANSVLGARTMKYPDFLDISIALTGRAPKGGPHMNINRLASLVVSVSGIQNTKCVDDSFYPLLGYCVGGLALSKIPVIVGIETLVPSKEDLKAFGAAFATLSSAPMFHIVGVTPEATVLEDTLDNRSEIRLVSIGPAELVECWNKLNSASTYQSVDLVSLGNPHFSFKEIRMLARLCRGRAKLENVAVVVTCGRSCYGLACQAGLIRELEEFGVQFITDTCWCMIKEPTIPTSPNAIMTNSGKYAHYGPGLTGKKFFFGSLARCVDAACQGDVAEWKPQWMLDQTLSASE